MQNTLTSNQKKLSTYASINEVTNFKSFLVSEQVQQFVQKILSVMTGLSGPNNWKLNKIQNLVCGFNMDNNQYFVCKFIYNHGPQMIEWTLDSKREDNILVVLFNVYTQSVSVEKIACTDQELVQLKKCISEFIGFM